MKRILNTMLLAVIMMILVSCEKSPSPTQKPSNTNSSLPDASQQSGKMPANERPQSEKLAAAMATDMGFELHLWAELNDVDQSATGTMASDATNSVILVAAGVLEVPLAPNPSEATKAVPSARRGQYIDDTVSQWVSQVRQRLKSNPYLQAHFELGNCIGAIRNSLAVSFNATEGGQAAPATEQYIAANLDVVKSVLNLPDVETTASQRSSWTDLAREVAEGRHTLQQIVLLRERLEQWLNTFVDGQRARAK